jgi:hypothetical protein
MDASEPIITLEQQINAAVELCGAKKVAVIDGIGKSAEVSLWLEYPNGNTKEIQFPKEWGDWVSSEFLRSKGYEVVFA